MRINLQPSFVLHTRPFRDTSLLVDLLTRDYGRINLLARNARGTRSRFKGILQPFVPFLSSWSGKTELMCLSQLELNGQPYHLTHNKLICAIYLNELLIRLLHREDPHPQIYFAYEMALTQLQQGDHPEKILRIFEKQLLTELGYGIELVKDSAGNPIDIQRDYHWYPEKGFIPMMSNQPEVTGFNGKSLLALHQHRLESPEDLRTAKRLLRVLLTPLLGDQPVRSRELFQL